MKIFTVPKVLTAILILGSASVVYFAKFYEPKINYNYEKIEPTDIIEQFSVTGRVNPINETDLTFEQSGKISEVLVEVGAHVREGSVLVRMTSEELTARRQEALASLQEMEAQLLELQNGTTQETINIKQSMVDTSQTTIDNAQNAFELQISESFLNAKSIIRTTINNLGSNSSDSRSKILFQANDFRRLNNLQNDKFYINQMINDWEIFMQGQPDLNESYKLAQKNLNQLQKYVEDLIYLTPNFWSHTDEGNVKLAKWKAEMATTQNSINTLISKLNAAYNNLLSTKKLAQTSSQELNQTTADTRPEQIAMQEARILGAQARINQIQALINKTVLKAPFDGVITKMEAKKGEVISLAAAKEILVSMISENYEIELYVPEIDIAKIEIGDLVKIRFDAFDDHEFESHIKFVEPAETIVQGVVYYQVKVELNPKEIPLEIRSGMSVDVDIVTDMKKDVIKIPQRRVVRDNGDKIVRLVVPNGETFDEVEVNVETGIRDDEGNIEITNGLKAGDLLLMESFKESILK